MLRFIYEVIRQRLITERYRQIPQISAYQTRNPHGNHSTRRKDQVERSKLWRLDAGNWGMRKLQGECCNQVAGLVQSLRCLTQDVGLAVSHQGSCFVKHSRLIIYLRALCEPQK